MAKDRIALVDEVRSLLREADEVGAGVECDFAAKQIVVEMSHFAENSIPGGVVASAIELSQAGWGVAVNLPGDRSFVGPHWRET